MLKASEAFEQAWRMADISDMQHIGNRLKDEYEKLQEHALKAEDLLYRDAEQALAAARKTVDIRNSVKTLADFAAGVLHGSRYCGLDPSRLDECLEAGPIREHLCLGYQQIEWYGLLVGIPVGERQVVVTKVGDEKILRRR